MRGDSIGEAKIVDSWRKNAASWTSAVRDGQIESRRLCTDRAIVEAITECSPQSVIDLGCGEGWLARALGERGIAVIGIDVVPELVAEARLAADGDFRVASYEDVVGGKIGARADVVVCNFSLLGKDSVARLFAEVTSLLNPGGAFIVQTVHPVAACGDAPYEDGWREGSWDGFGAGFTDPAPWYFRTQESWEQLFRDCGFQLCDVRNPAHPKSDEPLSTIFIAVVAG